MRTQLMAGTALALAAVVGLLACGGGSDALEMTQGTVISNATVVDTRSGALSRRSVVVDNGRITAVTSATVLASGTARVIDPNHKH